MRIADGKYYVETVEDFSFVLDSSGTKLSDLIAAPKDQTVLWTGSQRPFAAPNGQLVDNYYGTVPAEWVANAHGGKIMEQVLEENNIVLPEYSENVAVWQESSRLYASHAEGNIGLVAGETINPDGVFALEELPQLHNRYEEGRIDDVYLYDSYADSAGGKTTQKIPGNEFFGNDPSSSATAMEHVNHFSTKHDQHHEYGEESERQSDHVFPTAEEVRAKQKLDGVMENFEEYYYSHGQQQDLVQELNAY